MKICLVSEYYYPTLGGITEHVYQYAKQCLLKGHDVTLLTSEAGFIPGDLIPPGLKIHKIGKSYPILSNGSFARLALSPWIGKKVKDFFRTHTFDVVHVQAALMPMLPLLALTYRNSPIVGTMHTYFDRSGFYEFFQKQCQRALDAHDGLIAVSPSCIEAMERYFRLDAAIIPNGVDVDYFASGTPLLKYRDGVFNILFLGRLDPRNGLDTLIEAYHELRSRNVKARLLIAGDGPLRKTYENKVFAAYKQDVHFLGAINRERPDIFASVDAFCYPATKASFGITLLEAMSAGIPVVASKIRGFKELVHDGKEGLLVPETHPEALADAFEKLHGDRNLRIRMGEHGRKRAQEYAWDKVADQILDYYRAVHSSRTVKHSRA